MKASALLLLLLAPLDLAANPKGPGPAPQFVPDAILANQPCKEHILEMPHLTPMQWPEKARGKAVNAYVVVSYDLDGSGQAINIGIMQSHPNSVFNAATLARVSRARFVQGATAQSCRFVGSYAAVKRRS